MLPLNQIEFQFLISQFNDALKDYQLQEIRPWSNGFAIQLYRHQKIFWLVFDLNNNSPQLLLFENEIPLKKSPPKPVTLFLNSHAKNLYLDSAVLLENQGRVANLIFANAMKSCKIELIFIPRQVNVVIYFEEKKISWNRPKELKEFIQNQDLQQLPQRSLEQIHLQWIASQNSQQSKNKKDPTYSWIQQKKKSFEKKQKALQQIEQSLIESNDSLHRLAGEWIKTQGHLNVPFEYQKYINIHESLAWNINNCFAEAKKLESKLEGQYHRIQTLKNELDELANLLNKPTNEIVKLIPKQNNTSIKSAAENLRTRKLKLEFGGFALIGKSAADNIELLRKSKSWHLWLHLKDYPGAHAIILKEKNQSVPHTDMIKVAHWLTAESISSKSLLPGQKLEIIWTECRFVKPIKGDKLGRVTYQSEHHFWVVAD